MSSPKRSLFAAFLARFGIQLKSASRGADQPPWHAPLTPKEVELVELMATGHTDREIGERLQISPRESNTRVMVIMRKLNVRRRSEIVAWVARRRPS